MRSTASSGSKIPALLTRMSSGPTASSATVDELVECVACGRDPTRRVHRSAEVGNRLDVHSRHVCPLGGEAPRRSPARCRSRRPSRAPCAPRADSFGSPGEPAPMLVVQLIRRHRGQYGAIAQWMLSRPHQPAGRVDEDHRCRADRPPSRPRRHDAAPTERRTPFSCASTPTRGSSASARRTRRRTWRARSSRCPRSHSIARGLSECSSARTRCRSTGSGSCMFHGERPLRPRRRGAARDQRDRHGALGHRGQGRRAAGQRPARRQAHRGRSRLCERGDAGDRRGGAPDRRARRRTLATTRSSSAGGRSAATSPTTKRSIRAAREALGPKRALMIDGGRAYTVKRALELLRRVEEHELYWFEEAFAPGRPRRLPQALRRGARADRGGRGGRDAAAVPGARRARPCRRAAARSCALRRFHRRPADRRCSSARRTSRSSPIASRPASSSPPRSISSSTLDRPTWSEYSVADSPLVNGILREPFSLREGRLPVPTGPGLGIELDPDAIERVRLA